MMHIIIEMEKNSIEGAKQYEDYANDFVEFYRKQVARFGYAPRKNFH